MDAPNCSNCSVLIVPIILKHQSRPTLTIPDHKELATGLLRAIISQAGLNVTEFMENL